MCDEITQLVGGDCMRGTRDGRLISILVPIYNVERYILDTLHSIAVQTYPNFEVILIDDCSKDGTYDLVKSFCDKDSRFKVLRNERNLKIAETLNHALSHANGGYIARCDGDDLMMPDRLERQIQWLDMHQEIDLVGCSFIAIDESGSFLRHEQYPSGPELLVKILPYCTPVPHIWLARREVYDAVGRYRIPTVEDYDFLLRANANGFKFENIPNYYGMKVRVRRGNTVDLYGISQRNLFNYAKKVNSKSGVPYNDLEVERIMMSSASGLMARLHRYSDAVSRRVSVEESIILKVMGRLLAGVLSPLKMQYYFFMLVRAVLIRFDGWHGR